MLMKPYRLYTHRHGVLHKFGQRVPRVLREKGIRHDYDDLQTALDMVNYLWQNDSSSQYLVIDYSSKQFQPQIIAINMRTIEGE